MCGQEEGYKANSRGSPEGREYGESKMLSREGRAEDAVRAIHHQMEDTVLVEGRLSENVQMRGEKNPTVLTCM